MMKFKLGQRFTSELEPELGLGRVLKVEFRTVMLEFPAVGQQRIYRTQGQPPLKRFSLLVGEVARSEKGVSLLVETIEEVDGTLIYCGKGKQLHESDLSFKINARKEDLFERLAHSEADRHQDFRLRERGQELASIWQASPVRGMIGPRVDLIPHQYYLCKRACSGSGLPRLMLSDEVGLGKTIEAGMIWHTLRARGRALRTLVLVPESLKHQWMIEMMRRFNQMFTLVDEGYIQSLHTGDSVANPFLTRNEVICTFDLLLEEPALASDLLKSTWDLVIVDEAHHLVCEGGYTSKEFMVVNALTGRTRGMLLLTGTPLQLHPESHFNRLRLLDPARFTDFDAFHKDQATYQKLAQDLAKIPTEPGTELSWETLAECIPAKSRIREWLENSRSSNMTAGEWVRRIVDAMGTGSTVFRNTRKGVGGFPKRLLNEHALAPSAKYRKKVDQAVILDPEMSIDLRLNGLLMLDRPDEWCEDERIPWLTKFLKKHENDKVLLVCADINVVKALSAMLPSIIGPEAFVLFHEELELVSRDRAAAWFARKDGARLLIASEIGSEGRNFQFAHHLVLFDLPLDTALLEQRIGRLDRIGQRDEIHIHVPFVKESAQEVLFQWYNKGLNAFLNPLMGGGEVYLQYEESLLRVIDNPEDFLSAFTETLLPEVHKTAEALRKNIEKGRDKLLEFNSRDPEATAEIVHQVENMDLDTRMERMVLDTLLYLGVEVEAGVYPKSWVLQPTPEVKVDAIPGLPEEGLTVTTDRHEALDHDEISFLSWEHPLTQGVLDLVTTANFGTTACCLWDGAPGRGLLMQYNFVLEPSVTPEWGLSDLAGPAQLRVLIDTVGDDCSDWLEQLDKVTNLRDTAPPPGPVMKQKLEYFAGTGLSEARRVAQDRASEIAEISGDAVERRLEHEFQRVHHLLSLRGKAENSPLLAQMRKNMAERKKAAQTPQLRLDSLRLLICR